MASGESTAAAEMRSIVKRFGQTTALKGVDLTVRRGEIHALLGENGAGKSTLMNLLAGEFTPTSGEIIINQKQVKLGSPAAARKLGIAMVHQHFALAPALTVAENLALNTGPASGSVVERISAALMYSPKIEAQAALDAAERLGWKLDADRTVSSLSVGEQQRVEIVKALATDGQVLVFDEPTAVLNEEEVSELFSVLRKLRDANRAVILITHKLAEIIRVADRVSVLRRGENVATAMVRETNAVQLAAWMIGDTSTDSTAHSTQSELPVEDRSPNVSTVSPIAAIPVCVAESLCITGSRGQRLIDTLDMQVYPGEIFGIGGVDGNGQAELAETLARFRTYSAGSLVISAGRIGYIPQDRRREGLAPRMSVTDNLLFEAIQEPAYHRGPFLKTRELGALALKLIEEYDIRTPSSDAAVSVLSGGNQQKIVVARALRSNPEWIVAINPTRGLDIIATRFVQKMLLQARNRGAAVVVISTDLDELDAIADRTSILVNGRLEPYKRNRENAADIGLLLGGISAQAPLAQSSALQ